MSTIAFEDEAIATAVSNEVCNDIPQHQYVTFICNNEVFAVDMAPVKEIIRVPEVVQVPMASPVLNGLANLRGNVLPIVSLARIFGMQERVHDELTRAVVIDYGQPLGFVVDRVSSVVEVGLHQIDDTEAISGTVNSEFLKGLLKDVGGHSMTMVLDFEKLIAKEFGNNFNTSQQTEQQTAAQIDTPEIDSGVSSDELQLVSFTVAVQEYAIPIESVQEIVQMPETIIQVPGSQPHVVGVMTLRQRFLPLVSLRRIFHLPERTDQGHSRIVVVGSEHMAVGVVVDAVNEVLRVSKNLMDVMPGLLAYEDGLTDITQICRLEDGKRLVSVISTQNMFRNRAVQEVLHEVEAHVTSEDRLGSKHKDKQELVDDEEQVVVFHLGKEEFGVPIDSVQEIVRVPEELTHVPQAPAFVEGVINLRGAVLPVVDQRIRLNMKTLERNERQRIMVFLFDGVRTGFIVDSVSEVLKIHKSAISKAPQLSAEQSRLIGRVANLQKQKRLIQLLNPVYLLDQTDVAGLTDFLG